MIPNYKHYLVSSDGLTITNTLTGRELRQRDQLTKGKPTGYKYVTLYKSGELYQGISVHRLVALAHIPNPENKPWVNHKDGNKANNNALNLEWTTIQENILHSIETGLRTYKRGAEHHNTGAKRSQQTKKLQSQQKQGENHPKFKGYYFINGTRFASLNEAEKVTGTDRRTIKKRAEDPTNKDFYFMAK